MGGGVSVYKVTLITVRENKIHKTIYVYNSPNFRETQGKFENLHKLYLFSKLLKVHVNFLYILLWVDGWSTEFLIL